MRDNLFILRHLIVYICSKNSNNYEKEKQLLDICIMPDSVTASLSGTAEGRR
jgi:hypothetical protein